ncbi:unnamed protein product, partial [Amoebophrya sp. A25]
EEVVNNIDRELLYLARHTIERAVLVVADARRSKPPSENQVLVIKEFVTAILRQEDSDLLRDSG